MKQGLETKRLGEFCDIKHGYAFDGADFSTDYFGNNPIVLTPGNFSENATLIFNDKNTKRCTGDYSNNYVFNLGDLVVVMTDLSSKMKILGKPAIIENDNILHNQRIGRFVFFNDSINKKYLYYLLQSETYLKSIKDSATGTMVRHTAPQRILNFKIPVPPLTYQLRIVSIIDKAFAAIATAKANAEQNLKNAKELFESYLQGVFENKGEGWEEKKLSEICELKPPKKEARDRLTETDLVTFLPMEDLGVLNKEICGVKERQLKDVAGSYTYFANNDVLLAKITPCFENGKIGIARNLINGIGFGSSEYIVFRLKGGVEPEYLYYFLSRNQIREDGKKLMSGAVGHKRVSKDWIENYIIPFPKSLSAQQTIVQKLDALSTETKKLEAIYQKKLVDLDELKKSVLQKAFNGELS